MRYYLNFRDLDENTRTISRFHREVARLKKHLVDFTPDLIDAWGSMNTLPRNTGFSARMRIRLPTGTFMAEAEGYSRASAWAEAARDIEVCLQRHKARLIQSRTRQKKQNISQRWEGRPEWTEEKRINSVKSSIQARYSKLLEFLRAEIRLHEEVGNLPRRFIGPEELAGEVAMEVLQNSMNKPADLTHEHWFLKVAYERVMDSIDQARQVRTLMTPGPGLGTLLHAQEAPRRRSEEDDLAQELAGPGPRPRFGHDIPDPRTLP